MRKLPKQKKLFIATASVVPIVFLVGIWRSVDLLKTSFNSLLVLCVQKLEIFFNYFSHSENLLLLTLSSLLIIGFINGVIFFTSQLYNNSKLKKAFQVKLAKKQLIHIHNVSVLIVEDNKVFALTVGFLKPAIYISSELIKKLNTQELKSVIHHEHYHQMNFHPLTKLVINTFRSFLFFVPVMPVITKQLNLRQEALADRVAMEKTSRESLVSAFLKINQNVAHLTKLPATISQFSLTKDRLSLIIERTKVPNIKFPIILSILSIFIVSFFIVPLAWPFTQHAHAQVNPPTNSVESDINICHGLNQSLLSFITENQSVLNMTLK